MRIPYTMPTYKLDIISTDISQPENYHFQLIIGKLKQSNNGLELQDFIPACTTLCAHPRLLQSFDLFYEQLLEIQTCSQRVVKKIRRKREIKELAQNIMFVSEKITFFLAEQLDSLYDRIPQSPPIYLLGLLKLLRV